MGKPLYVYPEVNERISYRVISMGENDGEEAVFPFTLKCKIIDGVKTEDKRLVLINDGDTFMDLKNQLSIPILGIKHEGGGILPWHDSDENIKYVYTSINFTGKNICKEIIDTKYECLKYKPYTKEDTINWSNFIDDDSTALPEEKIYISYNAYSYLAGLLWVAGGGNLVKTNNVFLAPLKFTNKLGNTELDNNRFLKNDYNGIGDFYRESDILRLYNSDPNSLYSVVNNLENDVVKSLYPNANTMLFLNPGPFTGSYLDEKYYIEYTKETVSLNPYGYYKSFPVPLLHYGDDYVFAYYVNANLELTIGKPFVMNGPT